MVSNDKIPGDGTDFEVARWIWQNLVPASGQSNTLQGELLRAVEKLRWEAQNNGNGNWDDRFEMFIDFLTSTLCAEIRFSEDVKTSIMNDLNRLRDEEDPYLEEDLYDRLEGHVVEFCRLNPSLINRENDPLQYR